MAKYIQSSVGRLHTNFSCSPCFLYEAGVLPLCSIRRSSVGPSVKSFFSETPKLTNAILGETEPFKLYPYLFPLTPRPSFAGRGLLLCVCRCLGLCVCLCSRVNYMSQKLLSRSTSLLLEAFHLTQGGNHSQTTTTTTTTTTKNNKQTKGTKNAKTKGVCGHAEILETGEKPSSAYNN